MSFDIDMQSYAGEVTPAAVEQPIVDTNSYQQEAQHEDYPVHQEFVEQPQADTAPSRQELNFKALREEVDRIKAEKDELRQNLDLMRANMTQRPVEAPQPQQKMFEGLQDDDIPNVSDIRKAWERKESEYQSRIEELQVAQQHPDYAEVLEKYAIPLIKQKPHLAEGIMGARNKALFAYELGKMAQSMQTTSTPAPQPSAQAQRMVENSRKPGTLAQAGGQSVLSKADYFASMSDKEFMRMASKNLGEI